MPKMTNKTYVDRERVMELVGEFEKRGDVHVIPLAANDRVQGEGLRRLYIPKTKSVGRVDLSCYTMPSGPAFHDMDEDEKNGNVKQQLRFEGRTEEQILDALREALKALTPVREKMRAEKRKGPRRSRLHPHEQGSQAPRRAGKPASA